MSGAKKCPKCSGEMMHGDVTHDVRILKQGDFVGDKVYAFYYKDCGFVELYKESSTKEPWRMQKQQKLVKRRSHNRRKRKLLPKSLQEGD